MSGGSSRIRSRSLTSASHPRPHRLLGSLGLSPTYSPAVTCLEPRPRQDLLGQATRLVRRERVHRIDEDRLDALAPAALRGAMLEHGIQEALGLAGSGARGDERGQRRVTVRRVSRWKACTWWT